MVAHDDDFYTRKDSKITTLPKLTGRVSKCVQAFSLDWFPDEEKSVVKYLNKKYYQFKNNTLSLTRRQKWRFEKIQAERIARSNKAADNSQDLDSNASAQTGLVITRYGQHLLVESNLGNLVQCTARRNIDLSVAGDQVIFQTTDNNKGIVTALLDRDNSLKRSTN
ncbi:Ribosome small subunit-stimulated GTPase EngC [uncultured Gammaproteobacteria bacterium]|nr:Ribosome small subunit-stimulated GTPase EngC [uncultured Gammaproteobacteria bacterium]